MSLSIDPTFYSNITQPSKTRSAVAPIHSFPLEKRRITRKTLLDPCNHIYNMQGLSASNFRDADADAGKYYYIHINSYDTSPITTRIIDEVSPLLVNPTEFEPGAYYTYMIVSIIGKDPVTNETVVLSQTQAPELYATKTITPTEKKNETNSIKILYYIQISNIEMWLLPFMVQQLQVS